MCGDLGYGCTNVAESTMTAQSCEKLIFEGETHRLAAMPLEDYFQRESLDSPFAMISTALYRGYIGTWEIKDDRLFLKSIVVPEFRFEEAPPKMSVEPHDVPLKKIFPTAATPVFADWYTGELRCPQGEMLEYIHSGFGSVYEADILIAVEAGVVTNTTKRENSRQRLLEDRASFADAICGSCDYRKRLRIPPEFWDRLWLPIAPVWCASCKDVTLANHDEQPLCCLECGSYDLLQPIKMRGRGGWKMAWRLLRHGLKHGPGSTTLQFDGHEVVLGRPEYRCPKCQQYHLKFEEVTVSDYF